MVSTRAGILLVLLSWWEPCAARTLVVAREHPNSSDRGAGTIEAPFRTISRAAALALPGDTIEVRRGIYRERVTPPRGGEPGKPIVYMAAEGEKVVVRGSDPWKPAWKRVIGHDGVFSGVLPAIHGDWNPFREPLRAGRMPEQTAMHVMPPRPSPGPRFTRTLGQVIADGEMLREVETLADLYRTAAAWMLSPDGNSILVHLAGAEPDPNRRSFELTVRGRLFAPHVRGLGYVTVKGFTFEHCANQWPSLFWDAKGWPQMGAVSTRSGHHWIIERNTIRFAKTIGIDCGSEGPRDLEGDQPMPAGAGHHVIRENNVTDNGLVGIFGWTHTGTKIVGNVIERNNRLGFKDGEWESGGIKCHGFTDGLIEGNLIRDNDAYGIWLDNGWTRARVSRNVIVNNLWAGIFIELGWGPLTVDNNVIGYTRSGDGVYSHDSSDVTLAHNLLFANAGFGAWFQVTGKRMLEGKLTEASHERILNNLVLGNHVGAIGLPVDSERGNDNASEGNLIGPGSSSGSRLSGYGLFSIHSNGSNIEEAEMERAYREIFNGVPPDERPGKANWINRPIVGLQEWRTFTGRDLHSFVSRMPGYLDRPMLRSAALEVDLGVDESLSQVSCSAINGIEYDYFGARIPSCAQPGPFQGLNNGLNRISLWPQSRGKPR